MVNLKRYNALALFLIICLVTLTHAVEADAALRIGSFNINKLGCNNNKDLLKISKIINNEKLSIVALQEVCNQTGVDNLVSYLGAGWNRIVSDKIGRNNYKECYAFIFKESSGVHLGSYKQWDDSTDEFIREPFIAEFYHENKIYWLINIHIIFDSGSMSAIIQRKNELRELGNVYTQVHITTKNSNSFTIILGDFNLDAADINSENLPFTCYQTSKTTVAKNTDSYTNSYDHFCMSKKDFDKLKPKFIRIKAPEKYSNNDFSCYRNSISDHVPIRMDITSSSITKSLNKIINIFGR